MIHWVLTNFIDPTFSRLNFRRSLCNLSFNKSLLLTNKAL
ncbi:hypothetical protein GXM_05991 [Nostoc sphaeroides CCNUC1]|uniref:Uncharacterized protein n=1 Tax=Nostoc sphaeroides CCNUC1 TaxID=2653204 RepID=A0A5P8W6W3_9NOSO|nr:hypothetical protein GXM_05991 [Nostoc sphaeroides CCNUC1]